MEEDSAKRPDFIFIKFVNHSGKVNFKKNAFNDGKIESNFFASLNIRSQNIPFFVQQIKSQ